MTIKSTVLSGTSSMLWEFLKYILLFMPFYVYTHIHCRTINLKQKPLILRPNMTIPNDDIFLAGQSLKANRPAHMEFVGADANFSAESILKAIGKLS